VCREFESLQARQISGAELKNTAGHNQRVIKFEYGPLAQLVEQLTLNQRVVGSNPTRPTIFNKGLQLKL
jgi:hypothetical protein